MTESAHDGGALVRVEEVSFAYGDHTVLERVSLEVRVGDFWCILGSNGAGKTTLIRLLLGLTPPARGRIVLTTNLGPEKIGFVPQRCDWNRNMPTTVREFVELGLVGIALARSAVVQRLAQALEIVGLTGMEKRDYRSLSDGLRQRAVIARSLIRRPRLLLLDEPINGLDPATENAVMELLARLNCADGLTLLLVTHDVEVAMRYASHVALLHGGAVTSGPRSSVLTQANLRRVYGTDIVLRALGGHP